MGNNKGTNKEEEGNIKNEDKDKVEDEVQTVRPKRKEGGGESCIRVRRQLRRPVLPLRGSVRGGGIGKGTSSHAECVQSGDGVIGKATKIQAVQLKTNS